LGHGDVAIRVFSRECAGPLGEQMLKEKYDGNPVLTNVVNADDQTDHRNAGTMRLAGPHEERHGRQCCLKETHNAI
jgi:hypothetical protein